MQTPATKPAANAPLCLARLRRAAHQRPGDRSVDPQRGHAADAAAGPDSPASARAQPPAPRRPHARAARAGRRHRRRARVLGSLFAALEPAAGRSARSSPASCSARRCSAASRRPRRRTCCPPSVAPFLGVLVAGRRHPLHVPGRAGARPGAPAQARRTPRSPSRTPASSSPFLLGAALALLLYPRARRPATCRSPASRCSWASSMSVTAFPVLARILTDRGMHTTALGVDRADLRRGRRRHGVVPARVRGQRRAGAASRAALLTVVLAARLHRADGARRAAGAWRGCVALHEHRGRADAGRDGARRSWRCCCRRWPPSASASTRSSARSCSAPSSRTTAAGARR